MYIGWYGLGRFFIEGLRVDSLVIGSMRISQMIAAICVVVSVILLIVINGRVRRMGEEYQLYCNTDACKAMMIEIDSKHNETKKEQTQTKTVDTLSFQTEETDVSATESEQAEKKSSAETDSDSHHE